jgi:hypothetical protein
MFCEGNYIYCIEVAWFFRESPFYTSGIYCSVSYLFLLNVVFYFYLYHRAGCKGLN